MGGLARKGCSAAIADLYPMHERLFSAPCMTKCFVTHALHAQVASNVVYALDREGKNRQIQVCVQNRQGSRRGRIRRAPAQQPGCLGL